MNRPGWLAAMVIMLAPSTGFAQMGGGMGGRGGMMGGMGGGMGGMGGMMMGAGSYELRRAVQVEMEGGRHLSGQIDLATVVVHGDLGQYAIMPDKIKVIRFLKPANEAKVGGKDGQGKPDGGDDAGGGMAAGMADPNNPAGTPIIRAKIVMNSGEEIIGAIQLPMVFRLELDFGTLIPTADKLRTLTFTEGERKAGSAKADTAAPGAAGDTADTPSTPPRYFRQGNALIVSSPAGDRVTLYELETRKSRSLSLSGSKEGRLEITPIVGPNVMALALRGPKITRIAVADTASGTWYPQDLREPVEGRVAPIVGAGLAVYGVGRYVYAYSAAAHRWDVAELPEGLRATPVVGPNGATIEGRGHFYNFAAKTGKWDHVDVRSILDVAGVEKK
jgi:hypothetical protein